MRNEFMEECHMFVEEEMYLFTRRLVTLALAVLCLSVTPGPAIEPLSHRPNVGEVWVRTELYFGTDRPGDNVTDAQFRRFVDDEITPRFPDGLTLLTGYGQFLNAKGRLITERSKVLILFYPVTFKNANKQIEDIRAKYKDMFQQESVLRADTHQLISF